MDGQCFSCTEKFGIFRREHGCKNCGYSFCSKCLENITVVPGKGPKKQNVCNKCYKQLTAPPRENPDSGESQDFQELPENFKKRIAALGERKQNEKSHPSLSEASRKRGFAKSEDRDIAERLERLKADRRKMRSRTLSTEEIEDRLKKLKGDTTASSGSKTAPSYHPPDQRTPHEQTQDLLTEMHEEASIDANMGGTEINENTTLVAPGNKEEDLEQEMQKLMQEAKEELKKDKEGLEQDTEMATRLAKLNTGKTTPEGGRGPSRGEGMEVGDQDDEDEDEEAASQRLIKQLVEQDELEARTGALGYTSRDTQPQSTKPMYGGSAPPDPDELPWCCICNEDAILRCHGCDDDLYCKRCFREGHDGFDMKAHKTSSYRPPRAGQS